VARSRAVAAVRRTHRAVRRSHQKTHQGAGAAGSRRAAVAAVRRTRPVAGERAVGGTRLGAVLPAAGCLRVSSRRLHGSGHRPDGRPVPAGSVGVVGPRRGDLGRPATLSG